MVIIRRIYIYLVCAITLSVLTAAVLSLLWGQNWFGPSGAYDTRAPVLTLAFQIAMIVVAFPLLLVHWLWAEHLARNDEERGDVWRKIYLYGMLGVFLGGLIFQVLNLLSEFWLIGENLVFRSPQLWDPYGIARMGDAVIGVFVFAIFGLVHWTIILWDARKLSEVDAAATVRRLFVLCASAASLTLMFGGFMESFRWLVYQFGTTPPPSDVRLNYNVPNLVVGAVLWLAFWLYAQRLFNGPSEQEHESALRKFYLYLVVFVASAGAVMSAAFILDEILRQALGLRSGMDLRDPFTFMVPCVIVWAYHHIVLNSDFRRIAVMPRQAGVRRLYLYLVAGIGLASVLGGLILGGNVLIRMLAGSVFANDVKETLAWSIAAVVAGLPVWLIPWRSVQHAAVVAGALGAEERRSVVRKTYLYLYVLFATVTMLISAIYILSQFLNILLGGRPSPSLVTDVSQALGFALIAVCVWIYHGFVLRRDGALARKDQVEALGSLNVAVVDVADGRWGCDVVNELKRALPGLNISSIGVTPAAALAMGGPSEPSKIVQSLRAGDLIVGPWTMLSALGSVSSDAAQAIAASPARKLLVPLALPGFEWIGVERQNEQGMVRQVVRAIKQALQGQDIAPSRPVVVTVVLVVIAACVGLQVLWMLMSIVPFLMR